MWKTFPTKYYNMNMKNELNLKEIWKQTLRFVENRVDEDQVTTFIDLVDGSKLINIDSENSTAIVTVANKFKQVILKQNFNFIIQEEFRAVTNTDITLVFVIEEEYKSSRKEEDKEKLVQEEIILSDDLNGKYTFENFLAGKGNKVVFNACMAAASQPGNETWNPLFIYGGSGMGKTHLINAVGNHAKKLFPSLRVKYIQAADFTRILHDAFSDAKGEVIKSVENIKDDYQNYDMLLIDDIQYLEGKVKTSEVFFYILNAFLMNDKQVVISSDRYPEELKGFEDRLMTRFMKGLTQPVAPPDVETAKEIIRRKLIDVHQQEAEFLSDSSLEFLAQNFSSNVRDLEGALNKVIFYTIMTGKVNEQIDIDTVKEIFKGMIKPQKRGIKMSTIISTVAKYYGVKSSDIKGTSRKTDIAQARHIAIYLIKTILDAPYMEIAREFDRDHSTIMASVRKIARLIESDTNYSKTVHELTRELTK